jgi:Flp pilus assembly protein TadD
LLRKLLLVLSAAAMLTFGAAPAFAQQTAEATASNESTQTGNPTYSCEASGPGFAAAASGLTKKEAQDFEESHKAPGVSVNCKKD